MENCSLLRFACEIPEELFDRVNMGSELPLHVYAAGADLNGKVSEADPSASAGSRELARGRDLSLPSYGWLPRMDSNHDTQIQNLQCYRYTTRQYDL
jgi:hypothetical protein